MPVLQHHTRLTELILSRTQVRLPAQRHFPQQAPARQGRGMRRHGLFAGPLAARSCGTCLQVSEGGLRSLRRLGALQRLSLLGCQHLNDDCLAALPALSALSALTLERCCSKRITVRGGPACHWRDADALLRPLRRGCAPSPLAHAPGQCCALLQALTRWPS